jgi:hypothetical protein
VDVSLCPNCQSDLRQEGKIRELVEDRDQVQVRLIDNKPARRLAAASGYVVNCER